MSNPITPGIIIDLVAALRQVLGIGFPAPIYVEKVAVTDDMLAYACDFESADSHRFLKKINGDRRIMHANSSVVL